MSRRPSLNIKSVGQKGWESQRAKTKTPKALNLVDKRTKKICPIPSEIRIVTGSATDVRGDHDIAKSEQFAISTPSESPDGTMLPGNCADEIVVQLGKPSGVTPQRVWDLVSPLQ